MTARPHAWSIRGRLTRRVLALVVLAWGATVVLASLFMNYEINEMLDEELQTVADTTVLYLDASQGALMPRMLGLSPDNGERMLRILRLDRPEPTAPWPPLTRDGYSDAAGWRVLRVTAENAVIEVAHLQNWRREEVLEAASAFLLLILPMVGLLIWGLNRNLRQALAPIAALAQAVASRKPADLTPVSLQGQPDELRPMTAGLNLYLERIEAMRLAERRFVANAAHELRTPVASLRARLNLSSDPEARAALPQLDNLVHRVERLLQLSRSEAGLGLAQGQSDLVQLLRLLIREAFDRNKAAGIRFDDGDLEGLWVAGDADAVAILLRNLLENAVEHGSGQVVVTLTATGGVKIDNPTTGQAFLEAAFQKRAGSQGSGLGLAIVAELAQSMGVTVTKTITKGQARVLVQFRLIPPLLDPAP